MSGWYFDGRKDKTRTQVKKGTQCYAKTITEEHVTLVQEMNYVYIGHIIPSSGDTKSTEKNIFSFLDSKCIDTYELRAVGCDGTNVNTGAA